MNLTWPVTLCLLPAAYMIGRRGIPWIYDHTVGRWLARHLTD